MSTDTGAALAAAIRAAPDDDAPWLVYADWLQEDGRDAEAHVVRSHLPALREPVRSGHEVVKVVATAAVVPPGSPAWEVLFGRPPASADDFVGALPTWPEPAPLRVERPAEQRVQPPGPQLLFVPILFGFVILARLVMNPPVRLIDPPATFQVSDGVRYTPPQAPSKWDALPRLPTVAAPGRARWDRADVAGYTFRRVDGRDEERTFAFRPDGSAEVVVARRGHGAVRLTLTWAVDADGAIDITAPPSGRTPPAQPRLTRLFLVRELGNLYEVERDGRGELYVRER